MRRFQIPLGSLKVNELPITQYQPLPGLTVAVSCPSAVTRSRERLAMPLCGPCCQQLDSLVSSLRAL